MTLIPHSKVYAVLGLAPAEKTRIRDFLQGAVYCWCKTQQQQWFGLQDLMGGVNYDWGATPLQVLYDRQIAAQRTHEQAEDRAGKEGGHLLKAVLTDDPRMFNHKLGPRARIYQWIP